MPFINPPAAANGNTFYRRKAAFVNYFKEIYFRLQALYPGTPVQGGSVRPSDGLAFPRGNNRGS